MHTVVEPAGEAGFELCSVIREPRPVELDTNGLVEALHKFVTLAGRTHGAETRFDVEEEPTLIRIGEVEGLRMVQEAVHNVLRHSRASRVSELENVAVTVSDNGGF